MNKTVLAHHGILGQKWGVRRYQNTDGSLTPRGQARLDKKDSKWIEKKQGKIIKKTNKKIRSELNRYTKTELKPEYTTTGKLTSKTILNYNNKMAELMNQNVGEIKAPSGRVVKFVARRGELGVHTAVADSGYNMSQLQRGVFKDGKVAYKKQNLMKGR